MVAPVFAPLGVWIGSRQAAGTTKEHWRRDQLSQFAADLLAASMEVERGARLIHIWIVTKDDEKPVYVPQGAPSGLVHSVSVQPVGPPYPSEAVHRMHVAVARIRLLSDDLEPTASRVADAAMTVLDAALSEADDEPNQTRDALWLRQGEFERVHHELLVQRPPGVLRHLWRRTGSRAVRWLW